MSTQPAPPNDAPSPDGLVQVRPVSRDNWHDVARLEVAEAQREFVDAPTFYLALCSYGQDWKPLAIYLEQRVIGFIMWTIDPADKACWLGGFLIDKRYQRQGYGRQAIKAAMAMLAKEHGHRHFALSYYPHNGAQHLYHELGFTETCEWEGDEIVARLSIDRRDL
jgi:diamine N-acetyltransferase